MGRKAASREASINRLSGCREEGFLVKIKILFPFIFLILFTPPIEESISNPSSQSAVVGLASWYSESDSGINLRTANGEIFDDSQSTCASWDFPFGTYLKITHLANGKQVTCRVNDRGPAKRLGRLVDLTPSTFSKIAPLREGLAWVKVEAIEPAV